ncbi:MAG: hypothetical protein OXI79_06240 [Gammaproteobacteria bacterium]|nr:hypothetical protein [Gammaproteobacteria bacterium]MDE0659235.1 hypothetical protein [Gammaproteobacteria bacterium]
MGLEAIALGITQITAIVAMGVFLWQVFNRRFEGVDARFDKVVADMDTKFERVDARFDKLEARVEDLAKDHQSLARELSEFRGEMRGAFGRLAEGAVGTEPRES